MFSAPVTHCRACPLGTIARERCPLSPSHVPAGAVLCTQGERHPSVYLVRTGILAMASVDGAGVERGLSLRGPRALLGLEAMRGAVSPVEVRALVPTDLCSARGEALAAWAGPAGSAARAMLDLLLEELSARQADLELSRGTALSRVARLAAVLSSSGPVAVPKQVAARALGIRPETFSRCLARLVRSGVLAPGPKVHALDLARLSAVGAGVDGARDGLRAERLSGAS